MRVNVSARLLRFPSQCVCCGGPSNTEFVASAARTTGKRVVRTDQRSWAFPYCTDCERHARAWPAAWGCLTGALVVLTCGIWALIQLLSDERQKSVARSLCSPNCACPGWPARYLGWDGAVQSFDIASAPYAAAFASANGSGLVNVSQQLRGALEAASSVRIRQLEASAAAADEARVAAEDDRVPALLAEIERAKGPAGRRAVAERGFRELTRPDTRERLLVGAAKVETRLVLEKVDGLKSKAARRRHLEEGIAALRQLPIPEGVRAREISALEAALHEVEA